MVAAELENVFYFRGVLHDKFETIISKNQN
jgi:hypothetical protein